MLNYQRVQLCRKPTAASPAASEKLHYFRRTQHDSARPVSAPGSCCGRRWNQNVINPAVNARIDCHDDPYHKHAAAWVGIDETAQQMFNDTPQTLRVSFTFPDFFANQLWWERLPVVQSKCLVLRKKSVAVNDRNISLGPISSSRWIKSRPKCLFCNSAHVHWSEVL